MVALLAATGCVTAGDTGERTGERTWEVSINSIVDDGCSTSVVLPLSVQIAEEMACMAPDTLVELAEGNGLVFNGSAVLPYVSAEAAADLLAAVATRSDSLLINSGFRTVAQQYLLYRWYQDGRCGITAAATPGRSNHESGRALDIQNYADWKTTLEAHGWDQSVPGDWVHFDHLASPDVRGMDVHAFQRMWNRNNPNDLIDEDGVYGTQTGNRLSASPIEGFAVGPCEVDDGDPDPDPDPDPSVDPEIDPLDGRGDPATGDGGGAPDLVGGCSASRDGSPVSSALWIMAIAGLYWRRRRGIIAA